MRRGRLWCGSAKRRWARNVQSQMQGGCPDRLLSPFAERLGPDAVLEQACQTELSHSGCTLPPVSAILY